MDNFSITQNGKALDKSKYMIDFDNKTFSSKEYDLVLDFTDLSGWTFKTGGFCNFITLGDCIFDTGWRCTFKTGARCIFTAAACCTFDTGYGCIFNTGGDCTFDTGHDCTFTTLGGCTFKTWSGCTFETGDECTFLLYNINTCKFKSGSSGVILDRENNKHYLLNEEFVRLRKVTNG